MKRLSVLLAFLPVAMIGAFLGWVAFAMRDVGTWDGATPAMWIAIGLGLLTTGGLGAGLMWLAFHSSRRGHDDGPDMTVGKVRKDR